MQKAWLCYGHAQPADIGATQTSSPHVFMTSCVIPGYTLMQTQTQSSTLSADDCAMFNPYCPMTPCGVMTFVNSPYVNGNLYGAFNTRRYTLVQGLCFFWLFLMGCKELLIEQNKWTPVAGDHQIRVSSVLNSLAAAAPRTTPAPNPPPTLRRLLLQPNPNRGRGLWCKPW